eukprot:CAMPEP_0184688654 /NCGR_PEP_ID=MMETSP0312-20130426/30217_1 /TAXON_ID=31354 /ORGANISM="Compsopogon coeruleus, Strain SAG 36.94" /LENGTH=97 /DNA_ID=CAMNT_0027145911 /DNA_START=91 /DNA_END=384 /DNA_ORIENTATION=+
MTAFVGSCGSFVTGTRAVQVSASRKTVAAPRRATRVVTRMSVGELANVMIAEGGGMAVTFPAYLAVFLGTLFPVAFLIILFIQSEARKAGEEAGRGE